MPASSSLRANFRAKKSTSVLLGCFVLVLVTSGPLAAVSAEGSSGAAPIELRFVTRGGEATAFSLSALRAACPVKSIVVNDPYHARRVGYFAMSMICVLDVGFGNIGGSDAIRGQGLLLRALDGYTRSVAGTDLLSTDAYVAFGEVELMGRPEAPPRFSRIDRRNANPAPFYLVWKGKDQNDPHGFPWPYQLATIEEASFRQAFPQTVPVGLDEVDAGWAGYAIFENSCSACHSINGEGGKVGPDLNVPRSIVEYRPIEQIKAYIRDPEATRYTNMPAHPDLSDADLDSLIAYFRAMSSRKHDPRAPFFSERSSGKSSRRFSERPSATPSARSARSDR